MLEENYKLKNTISGKIILEFVEPSVSHTNLGKVFQTGYSKVRFSNNNNTIETILINTAGGLTGSDIIENNITMKKNSCALITSQAAEKIYRNKSGFVSINTNIEMESSSFLQWIPQETIIYNKSRMKRQTNINLQKKSNFLGLESVMFGRQLFGEKLENSLFSDCWKINIENKLMFVDHFIVDDDFGYKLKKKFILNNIVFISTIAFYTQDLEMNGKKISDYIFYNIPSAGMSIINGIGIIKIVDKNPQDIKLKLNNIIKLIQKNIFNYYSGLPAIWSY